MSLCCIGLHNPKNPLNVGSVLRAAHNYSCNLLAISGPRYKHMVTDTMNAYKYIPLVHSEDLHSLIPYDCIPVAVDLIAEAKPLMDFKHPKNAFYVFGPEDGTLGKSVLDWCKHKVFIPTNGCMNLAATVNVVLYDRLLKGNK